ncbi:MAG: response regulator [Candidatus Nomurabacteria bacterium]|jgi:DNA-binding response OmpR family regulator|nr:response regulator [Candidatus Nomurabacteria bacterium]
MTKKILCIEDDRLIGEMYQRALEKAGYTFVLKTDGDEGLQEAYTTRYDFILLDLMLPNKKGDEVLSVLRAKENPISAATKVIILTNFQQDDSARAGLERKVDAYLIKADITPSKLISILKNLS